jgi:hypothetical protein
MHEGELQLELHLGVIHYVPVRAAAPLDANSWRRGRRWSLGQVTVSVAVCRRRSWPTALPWMSWQQAVNKAARNLPKAGSSGSAYLHYRYAGCLRVSACF